MFTGKIMGRKRIFVFLVLALVAAVGVCLLFNIFSGKSVVSLYFADADNAFLISEQRSLSRSSDPAQFGRVIIESLIEGPGGGLGRTIPGEAVLRAFYIAKDGTAYADFTAALRERHPGGSSSELLTVYSIVNSLIMNIPEIKRVKILIEGRESLTLVGHIDLRSPFKANSLLVR